MFFCLVYLYVISNSVTDLFEPVPLGMESYFIPTSQLTASSTLSYNSRASRARLRDNGAWCAAVEDLEPWLQIEFTINATIAVVSTQGSPVNEHWVENYTLAFAIESNVWQDYKENGQIKVSVHIPLWHILNFS